MDQRFDGSFAVVTGASSGIGYHLASQFVQNGFDVLIAAEDEDVNTAAQELSGNGGQVRSLQCDLSTYEGVEQLWSEIRSAGRTVDVLCINAGIGVSGLFAERELAEQLNLINLNVTSGVHLTHRVLQQMLAQHKGKILFTSSIAATSPGPFEATYNASKAFMKSFAEAIRNELKDSGITITTLMPGPTETNFFHRAGAEDTRLAASKKNDAAVVAREGFEALMDGKDHVIAGSFKNKVQATMSHLVPDTVAAQVHRKQSEPGSANK